MRKKQTSAARTHRRSALLYACGLLAFIAVFAAAGVKAKYIHTTAVPGQAVAAEFYFASDFLSTSGTAHTVTALEADGTASVTFALQNHADALRYSAVNIDYTVSVDNGGTVNPASDTMQAGQNHDASITLSNLQPGHTYTVTATATAPYTAVLKGTITVQSKDTAVHCTTADHTQYIEATVWTVDYSGGVTLTYPAGLIPDNTDSMMADWQTGEQTQTFNMETNSAHVFRFFKGTGYTGSGSEVTASAKQ